MSFVSPPQTPLYRVTLFYGPESVDTDPSTVCCVFNVKKRSWKGGVQVVVEVDEPQLASLRNTLEFEEWLVTTLDTIPDSDRPDYDCRARDLLVQQICQTKLHLALRAGLRPENCHLSKRMLVQELDGAVINDAETIKKQILREIDVEGATSL